MISIFNPSFHFAENFWFWGLLIIPVVWFWRIFTGTSLRQGREKQYADEHLLPFLTGISFYDQGIPWSKILLWTLSWLLLIIAMAEPRWDTKQINTYHANTDLIILLDISSSMNVTDIKPSRLRRAKQEIEDLLKINEGIKTGLIAFASAPAMITPITFDKQSLLHQLPALSSQLVTLKGSRLEYALQRVEILLQQQPKNRQHHLLLLSDGDFDNPNLIEKIKQLRQKNCFFHVLGMGTETGAPIPTEEQHHLIDKTGRTLISALNIKELKELASAGGGIYVTSNYDNNDSLKIIQQIKATMQLDKRNSKNLIWNAHYHWVILLAMILLIFLYPTYQEQRK